MFVLDLQSRIPIYEQLKNNIMELVAAGALRPDEQLPSVRSLAHGLGMNPNTVQKAYQELERDGVLYSVAGRGSFVARQDPADSAPRRAALAQLRTALGSAKRAGITWEDALREARDVYGEETL